MQYSRLPSAVNHNPSTLSLNLLLVSASYSILLPNTQRRSNCTFDLPSELLDHQPFLTPLLNQIYVGFVLSGHSSPQEGTVGPYPSPFACRYTAVLTLVIPRAPLVISRGVGAERVAGPGRDGRSGKHRYTRSARRPTSLGRCCSFLSLQVYFCRNFFTSEGTNTFFPSAT